jgi:hypothetical protein
MIRHLVLFNLKPDLEPADRDWLFSQIRELAKIRTVQRFALGKLLEPREEWYKPRVAQDYEWALSMEFEDEDALYVYQQDPGHVVTAAEIRKRVSVIRVMDFVSP